MSATKEWAEQQFGENYADINEPTGFEDYDRSKEQLAWEAEQERFGGGRF